MSLGLKTDARKISIPQKIALNIVQQRLMMTKKIGILTSGGDCPGLNAVIRAVVRCANRKNWTLYGIPYSTDGLMHLAEGLYRPEDLILRKHGYELPGMLHGLDVLQFLSGSVLGSLSKGNTRHEPVRQKILKGYEMLGLDALIVVGGDGSIRIISELARAGNWNMIAVPKTIDNDVPFTERSVGFDTAVDTVTKALYDLTFTAASHDRVMIAQVMGRDAGHLALQAGITGGADIILIPELVPNLNEEVVRLCCQQISQLRQEGRQFALIVIAEGVRNHAEQRDKHIGDYLENWIKEYSHHLCHSESQQPYCEILAMDTRVTVLGHLQRSGTPTSYDRLLATTFGIKAINLIEEGKYSQLVVWRNGEVDSIALEEVWQDINQCTENNPCAKPVKPNDFLVKTAQELGICLGLTGSRFKNKLSQLNQEE